MMSKRLSARGSILIWTLLLGLSLATVFFFFSQRLNSNVAAQRETIEYQNARLFFESYAAYLQSLSRADLETLRNEDGGNISFEGITGTITNEVESITGELDAGATVTYKADPGTDNIKIEWDPCGPDDTEILEINGGAVAPTENACLADGAYEKVAQVAEPNIWLEAVAGPVNYKLTQTGEAVLYDNRWQVSLEYPLNFRRKLTTNLSFIAE